MDVAFEMRGLVFRVQERDPVWLSLLGPSLRIFFFKLCLEVTEDSFMEPTNGCLQSCFSFLLPSILRVTEAVWSVPGQLLPNVKFTSLLGQQFINIAGQAYPDTGWLQKFQHPGFLESLNLLISCVQY